MRVAQGRRVSAAVSGTLIASWLVAAARQGPVPICGGPGIQRWALDVVHAVPAVVDWSSEAANSRSLSVICPQ
ncbi:hypothetical protein [Arthrobacter sp. KK5.5]|uniref:hypothetical protein n=1 Tax=Arthrobacter sp. KK5.5 TaxID=3373084 RepID=UPI003EE6BB1F